MCASLFSSLLGNGVGKSAAKLLNGAEKEIESFVFCDSESDEVEAIDQKDAKVEEVVAPNVFLPELALL